MPPHDRLRESRPVKVLGERRRICRTSKTGATGLEPATSGVTGRRSNQLNYAPGSRGSVASVHPDDRLARCDRAPGGARLHAPPERRRGVGHDRRCGRRGDDRLPHRARVPRQRATARPGAAWPRGPDRREGRNGTAGRSTSISSTRRIRGRRGGRPFAHSRSSSTRRIARLRRDETRDQSRQRSRR